MVEGAADGLTEGGGGGPTAALVVLALSGDSNPSI